MNKVLGLTLFLSGILISFRCGVRPESGHGVNQAQKPKLSLTEPKTWQKSLTMEDFLACDTLSPSKLQETTGWRSVVDIPGVQFQLPAYLNFRFEMRNIDEKPYRNSTQNLKWRRYEFVDTALNDYLQKHSEGFGTEAATTVVVLDVYPDEKIVNFLQRRLTEDPIVAGYSVIKKVDAPAKGYFLRLSDMFSYHYELILEANKSIYVFSVTGPVGPIPKPSRLTDEKLMQILTSLRFRR